MYRSLESMPPLAEMGGDNDFSEPWCALWGTTLRALTRILKIGVRKLPSRKSWSFSIHFYWHFSKSWSQIQKVGVKNSIFGVNESSDPVLSPTLYVYTYEPRHEKTNILVSYLVRHKPGCTVYSYKRRLEV